LFISIEKLFIDFSIKKLFIDFSKNYNHEILSVSSLPLFSFFISIKKLFIDFSLLLIFFLNF